jgi:ATP-dependent DNA helicase DinG
VKPPDLGLPWPEWRKGQWEVITQALASPHKYVLIEAPPGIGKSGIALAISRILDARSAHVLTGTLQLQQQYEQLGVTSVTGRPNWQCFIQPGVTAADAPCTAGMKCEYSGPKGLPGCDYFDQKRQASAAAEVVFNYAYWLRQLNYAGWRKPSVLVCDEAHTLAGQVRSFAQTAVRRRALTELGYFNMNRVMPLETFEEWQEWARHELGWNAEWQRDRSAARRADVHEMDRDRQRWVRMVLGLNDAISTLAAANDDWVVQPQAWGWEFKPVWVHTITPRAVLAHATEKVILLSATILNKDVFCGLNGIDPAEAEFIQTASTFSKRKRPVVYRPIGRVTRAGGSDAVIRVIREILGQHPGERGLVHTVSHRLAREIGDAFRGDPRIITHDAGADRLRALERFKRTRGAVLVSPSMHTGVDLPYDECRFQVICKLPFADLTDPLVASQMKNATRDNPLDKGQQAYTYDTAATLVQTYGRIMRAEDDSGTTYLLDENYKWFKHAAREFLPTWFTEAVKYEDSEGVREDDVLADLRRAARA